MSEYYFTTHEELQVVRKEDGVWNVFDFDWDLHLFSLPAAWTEEQVRVVCRIVNQRMDFSFAAGRRIGRSELQGEIARLLALAPSDQSRG